MMRFWNNRNGLWAALLAWLILGVIVIDKNVYGLNEGGARDLLYVWSVIDHVANPIILAGTPDLRTFFFIPVGLYWTGSVLAAKIFTLVIAGISIILLFQWAQRRFGHETALITSGLLLIAPLSLYEINSLGAGIYCLLCFALSTPLDQRFRKSPIAFSGYYFSQLFFVAVAVSLHPMGLAYPLALAQQWRRNPVNSSLQKQILYGVGITSLLFTGLRLGWQDLDWLSNPLVSLGYIILGPNQQGLFGASYGVWGGILLLLTALLIFFKHKTLREDLCGASLLYSCVIGLLVADTAWALMVMALMFYTGIAQLLHWHTHLKVRNFIGQRGIVLALILLLGIQFMLNAKTQYLLAQKQILTPTDQLLFALSLEVQQNQMELKLAQEQENKNPHDPQLKLHLAFLEKNTPRIASQWPARTMVACQCFVVPLPPPQDTPEKQLQILGGAITHLVFDHQAKKNQALVANIAQLSGQLETTIQGMGGVVVRVRAMAKPAS